MTRTRMFKTCVLVALASMSAYADLAVMTVNGQELFAVYRLPSGEEKKERVGGYQGLFLPDTVKQVPVTVQDASGAVVASATLQNGRAYLAVPATKQLVPCGFVGSSPSTKPLSVVLLNSLDEAYTVDLFGRAGVGGVQNVAVPVGYDSSRVVKLPKGESTYRVILKGSGGTEEISDIRPGAVYVLRRDGGGHLEFRELGSLR
jgi:hypothetical protein